MDSGTESASSPPRTKVSSMMENGLVESGKEKEPKDSCMQMAQR